MKITFITYHNWETKRIGGFHKLAEAAVSKNHDVIFFSFPRPYYIQWKNDERLNKQTLKELSNGKKCDLPNGKSLINCTWPTLSVPGPLRKVLNKSLIFWLEHCSFKSFSKICEKWFEGTDVFIYESCGGLILFDRLKRLYPLAKHIYRPSDPLMIEGCPETERILETHVLINSDLNLLVNNAGFDLYSKKIKNFENLTRSVILRNGVDVSKFRLKYPIPKVLQKPNTALYVGAIGVEWNLILKAASELPDVNFIIICPVTPPVYFLTSSLKNLTFICGIEPSEVPLYVTNCRLIIVPNPQDLYKKRPWGITAKYYQAMIAGKPIVSFSDTEELTEFGVYVSNDYDTFISQIREALNGPEKIEYNYSPKDWQEIGEEFLSYLS